MEVNHGNNSKILVCLYELMGTALFVYCVLASGGNVFAVIMGLFAAIIIFGGYTGGHFNPAVTLGVYVANGKYFGNLIFLVLITASQFAGAAAGLALAWLVLMNSDGKVDKELVGVVGPNDPSTGKPELGAAGFNLNVQNIMT